MEPTQKIKLPVPYEQKKESKSLKKIDTKLKSLNKTGTEKILTFVGSNEVEAMFYLYLFKKYKSNCFLHDKFLKQRILGMSILISETYKPLETGEIQIQLDSLSKILVDCIKNNDTKIIIVPVQLRFTDGGAHANVLIYRKNLNQIEHFEPHGQNFYREKDATDNKIIEKWMKYFVLKINARLQLINKPAVKFIESSEVCPYIDGLQNLESWSNLTKLAGVEPGGYCAAWSMFFTELCLKNPEIPSSVLINYIFDTLQNMASVEKMNYLKSVIRGYSIFINQKINKYFSVFFNCGLTIQKIKEFSRPELNNFRSTLRYLIDIEMNLSTNPNYLKTSLERTKNALTFLNKSLKIDSSDDAIKKEIKMLTNKKKLFEIYDKVKFSNPTDSISQTKMSSPKLLKNTSKQNIKIKSCPPGKEINPKTGRCVKTKTQKVKKIKVPKVKTPKKMVEIKLEPEPVKEQVKEVLKQTKSCPPGKEINPKTGRCVKTKTQKVKKVKIPKVKTPKVEPLKVEPLKVEPPKVEPIICPEGCVKIETKKDEKIEKIEKIEKKCPEGKELNPKTGRCVKTKIQKVKTRKQKI
jgi:hypothetical protein